MIMAHPSDPGIQPPIGQDVAAAGQNISTEPRGGATVTPAASSSSTSTSASESAPRSAVAALPTVFLSTSTPNSAYLTPATYHAILRNTLALHLNPSAVLAFQSRRQQATGLIAAVGARVGLPQRTINTAFVIWQKSAVHRGSSSGTSAQQVAIAALFLACKLNDTPKKARDLIVASYAIRYPDLIKANLFSSSVPGGPADRRLQLQQLALASVQESDVDVQVLDAERNKVLNLERTLLEEFGYDFKIRSGVESVGRGVIKLGRAWKADKQLIQDAWQMASDVHRTSAPLIYPPLILSLAALLTASLLCPPSPSTSRAASAERLRQVFGLPAGLATELRQTMDETIAPEKQASTSRTNGTATGPEGSTIKDEPAHWAIDAACEEEVRSFREEVQEVTHDLLDLYLVSCSTIASAQSGRGVAGVSPTSPASTPISPSSPSDYGISGASMSSKKGPGQPIRLPVHTFNPPPLSVIAWLQADCASPHPKGVADLVRVLTDCKIKLRGAEDARKIQQEELAKRLEAQHAGSGGQVRQYGAQGTAERVSDEDERQLARRIAIEQGKAGVQVVKVVVQREGEEILGHTMLVPTVSPAAGDVAATPSATMSLTLTPLPGYLNGTEETAASQATAVAPTTPSISALARNGSVPGDVVPQGDLFSAQNVTGQSGMGSSTIDGANGPSARSYKTSRFLF